MTAIEATRDAEEPTLKRMRLVLLILSALSALAPLAIDIVLPSFGAIETALSLEPGAAAATMSLFLFGFATGPLVFGAVSDRLGRRPLLLLGLVLFTGASLVCASAPNREILLAARLIEGIGAGAASALPIAIVRDLFQGPKASQSLSIIIMVGSFAPIIAPLVGAAIYMLYGWRAIFLIVALSGTLLTLGAALLIKETLKAKNRQRGGASQVMTDYLTALRDPVFLGFSLGNGFNFGCMFAYISASPRVFSETFGLSAGLFSFIFAITAAGIIGGASWNTRQLARNGKPLILLRGSLLISLAASLALLILALTGITPIVLMLPLLILNNFAVGVARPNATYEAMLPMAHIAGSASALLRGVQMLMGAIASSLVSLFHEQNAAVTMATLMSIAAVPSFLCCQFIPRLSRSLTRQL